MYNGRVTLRYDYSSVSESWCSGPPGLMTFTVTPTGMVIAARSRAATRLARRLARRASRVGNRDACRAFEL